MLKSKILFVALVALLMASCKGDEPRSEAEIRGEVSKELENAGLHKQSHHSDEQIAALNVIYKTPYISLQPKNKDFLNQWSKAMDYGNPEKLYNDMFESFNISEQVGSLVKEYSGKKHASYYDRDVYNQSVAMLVARKNDPESFEATNKLFQNVYKVTGDYLSKNNIAVDAKTWNKGMSKEFTEYWYVHSSRILDAIAATQNTTLQDFLSRVEG